MYVLDFPLSRLSYAAHTEDAVDVSRAGFAAWVGRQLDPKIRSDADLDQRLRAFKLHIKYAAGNGEPTPNGDARNWPAMDEMRPLTYLDAPIERPWAFLESKASHPQEELARPYQEVAAATVFRAAHSRAQLYEQMVGFWHDHFNVLASDDKRIGCALPSYDRDAIRPHALGNFRDLLEAVAKSPAMLIYLSNASSRAGAANENYARELMELHTLGLVFPVNDPPFFIQELQFKYNDDKNATGLPGTIKVGAWQHTGDFEHLRLDGGGVSTALSGNDPNLLSGNFGFYIIADQQIYRFAGGEADHGVHVFGRLSTSPEDRSLVDFYADGGVVVYGANSARPNDAFGVAAAYAQMSNEARALDRELNAVNGTALPVRSFEAAFEAYYKFQVAPGLTVQPDLQYIINPGGNIAGDDGDDVDDALVGGVRVTLNY